MENFYKEPREQYKLLFQLENNFNEFSHFEIQVSFASLPGGLFLGHDHIHNKLDS